MVYALMFDAYQAKVRDDQWCVSRSGSIEFCRQYVTLTDDFVPWAKSDFGDRIKQENHPIGGEAGAIYELTRVADFSASMDTVASKQPDPTVRVPGMPIGWAVGGFVAGVVAGVVLHGRVQRSAAGDDK